MRQRLKNVLTQHHIKKIVLNNLTYVAVFFYLIMPIQPENAI